MNKKQLLKIINPIIGILLVNQVVTSMLEDFIPKEVFEGIHGGGGALLVAGVAVHLYCNWAWVEATYLRKNGKKHFS